MAQQATFDAPAGRSPSAAGPFLELRRATHRTIKRVTEGMEGDLKFNTAIAALMELVNELYGARAEPPTPSGPR